MKKKLILAFLTLLLFSSCGGSNKDEKFKNYTQFPLFKDIHLVDFKLNDKYDYWEIRRGGVDNYSGEEHPDDLVFSFDKEQLDRLSTEAKLSLTEADATTGFASQCQPGYCPIYGVGIKEDEATLLTSKEELLNFFDTIDTPAELLVWVWANDYNPKSYKEIDGGYSLIVGWDNLCGSRGDDLIEVESNTGEITKKERLSTESYSGCV